MAVNQARYKRLGFLSLDSNERSSFEARELKSVHVNGQVWSRVSTHGVPLEYPLEYPCEYS